ncbi:MAG: glycosyltransferase [Eubacteriales bacterium]|nr:glycosyltransferase [Eubacteriales bacterium]
MKELPLLSVIVPVYKVEAYLDRCVDSLVQQTYDNLEILLVDDGSPDSCGVLCDRWAARDPRVRVIHQKNGGAGKARNTALDQARGELIGMVDSDDYIEPHMYQRLYSLLGENIDIVECQSVATENDYAPLDDGKEFEMTEVSPVEAMREHIQNTMFTQVIWNKLYRRSVIGDIRFPEGNLIDDEFFTYRVIGNARRLAHTSAKMYAYRQQPGSVMHETFSLRRLQGLQARKERLDYLKAQMPELVYEASVNLYFFCIYAEKMSLRFLPAHQLPQARTMIRKFAAGLTPLRPSRRNPPAVNFWLVLAQISFDGVCKIQNYLDIKKQL